MTAKIYNNEDIILGDGTLKTYEEIKNDTFFSIMTKVPCVIFMDDNDRVYRFEILGRLKETYGIDESDNDAAAQLCYEAVQRYEPMERSAYENVPELINMNNENQQAIGELGVSTAALLESNSQLTSSNADVLQAIGELGAMVAAMQVSPDTPSNVTGETA